MFMKILVRYWYNYFGVSVAHIGIVKLTIRPDFFSGYVTYKALWPPATNRYGGLRPLIGFL